MLINKTVFHVAEVACLLGCSSYTIYHLIYSGQLGAYKMPGHRAWNIPEESIQSYKAAQMSKQSSSK